MWVTRWRTAMSSSSVLGLSTAKGRRSSIGVSRTNSPSSHSCITAAPVTVLLTDASMNGVSVVAGASSATLAQP